MTIIWNQEATDAATDIVSEFNLSGEVLQAHSCGEYCDQSSIGKLSKAIEHPDRRYLEACKDPDDGTGCANCGAELYNPHKSGPCWHVVGDKYVTGAQCPKSERGEGSHIPAS